MAVKNCFIRGSVVRYVQLPAEHVDTQLLEDATRRGAFCLVLYLKLLTDAYFCAVNRSSKSREAVTIGLCHDPSLFTTTYTCISRCDDCHIRKGASNYISPAPIKVIMNQRLGNAKPWRCHLRWRSVILQPPWGDVPSMLRPYGEPLAEDWVGEV